MDHNYGRLDPHDRVQAIQLLDDIRSTPGSWCNMTFEELEESDNFESPLFSFLAARGPANALATIMRDTAEKPLSVGIQHQAGTKAAQQLREADLPLPKGARVRQDHPRRGLVVEWPDDATTEDLADWLFAAMRVLNRTRIGDFVGWTWSVPPTGN